MMEKIIKCPICGAETPSYADHDRFAVFYSCPVCGRFELEFSDNFNRNQLAPYLLYHSFRTNIAVEYRYHTSLDKDICDRYRKEFDAGKRDHGRPVHMDADIISAWFPKSFSERVDYILLYLGKSTAHIGQGVEFCNSELLSWLFVDRYDVIPDPYSTKYLKHDQRDDEDCNFEAKYMLDYLQRCGYITWTTAIKDGADVHVTLTPEGYARIDALQKNTANGKNVLVAMKFGDDTKALREAIRQGITEAEYVAIFIDEVQHNDFITPELLKYIRDSKFVVVDLTHQNNGAYFEEGYAMGLGKPVIQLCKKDTQLHFDIAQKNTIIWSDESEIPERLVNRIKATID